MGSDWENKSAYVHISENATPNYEDIPPLPGYSRTRFQCTDAMSDGVIGGCDIELRDMEGAVWSNKTSSGGTWFIDTLPLHHINAYGQSTGYSDGSRLGVQEWSGMTYTIPMIPGYVPPAADGKIWVYVHVTDWMGTQDIQNAYVSLSGYGLTTKSDYTDASGIVHLQWSNSSTAYINVVKPGYTTEVRVVTTSAFGPDVVTIAIHAGTVSSTITPTPGGTAIPTVNPWGTPAPGGTMPAGYTNNQGQEMMDFLAANGMSLVEICFMVTILALLGVKLGK